MLILSDDASSHPILHRGLLYTPVLLRQGYIDARLAASRASAFGLGQLVVPGLAGQVVRQAAAAVRPAAPLGLTRRRRFGRCLGGRVLARGHVREQQGLVGIEALAARPV